MSDSGNVSRETRIAARACRPRQRKFAELWVASGGKNAAECARLAGATVRRARTSAVEWRKHPNVQRYISCLEADAARAAGALVPDVMPREALVGIPAADAIVSGSKVLNRLADVAFVDMADFWTAEPMLEADKDGNFEQVFNADGSPAMRLYFDFEKARKAGKTHLIQEITVAKDGSLVPKFPPKETAMVALLKALGMDGTKDPGEQERLWAAFLSTRPREEVLAMHRAWLSFGGKPAPALPPRGGGAGPRPQRERAPWAMSAGLRPGHRGARPGLSLCRLPLIPPTTPLRDLSRTGYTS